MDKKTTKFFSLFWFIAGIIWVVATIRHTIVNDDMIGAVIYIIAAAFSFILAFAYYGNFVK